MSATRRWCSLFVVLGVLVASPGSIAAAKPKPKIRVTTTKAPVNKLYKLTVTGTYDSVNEGGGEKGTISLDVGVRVQHYGNGYRTSGSGELQIIGFFIDKLMPDDKVCQTPAAGKILAQVDVVAFDTTSEDLSALPPVGTVAFSLIPRIVTAPGTGPSVGCPDGSKLTFDGLYAVDTFLQGASKLAFKPGGETLRRTSGNALIKYDMTFTLVPLN